MTRLLLVRHGETAWNVEGRYQGQADPPLNERGQAQAAQLAGRLAGAGIDVIYASPLRRALQTAEAIARRTGAPVRTDPRLMEIHQGRWQEQLVTDIQANYPELFARWQADPWRSHPPEGESLTAVQQRVSAAVDDILAGHRGQTVALVTHRIPIGLIKMRFQDWDENITRAWELPNVYVEEINVADPSEITDEAS
ncbi:MAG TPA: histidine phosphatase family protein [Anaerolineaceae bacterium]|nr:histidine phosphatase family protein [Anaerolineaceae bacterium]